MTKEWYSATELAGMPGVPGTARGINKAADRDGWSARKKQKGKGREYHISSLPEETRKTLAAESINSKILEASKAGHTEGRAAAITHAIDTATAQRIKEQGLANLTHLTGKARERAESRLDLLSLLEAYAKQSKLPASTATTSFCHLYNHAEIDIPDALRATVPHVHPATIYRWRKDLQSLGAAGLSGRYGHRKGTSKIDSQPELQKFCIAMLTDHPHASAAHLMKALRARFLDGATELPSKRSVERWMSSWKQENAQLLAAVSNPDAWKNNYMVAMGSASEDITRLNQRWEFDSTPADVMLIDGRFNITGIIDIWSRRAKLLVSKTSKSTAVATTIRRAILAWGVPEQAKTDNGKDYVSNHVRRVFDGLEIEQVISNPFSPWEKPHIERFFRTFSHDLVELLHGYIGHNVSDRQAIEARKSFSDRLFKKDAEVELNMTAADLQRFCDRWLDEIYLHQVHGSLGMSPFQKAASHADEIRRISDERVLDILLAEAPGDGTRTVSKKGIHIDRIQYIAPELGAYVGQRVKVLFDPDDLGRIYVYGEEGFICCAEAPEYTGISRQEVAAVGRQIQKARIQEAKRQLKASARTLKTKDIAEEILNRQAEESDSLVEFPRPTTEHTSEGITAAGDTLSAIDDSQDNYVPPVDEAAIRRVQSVMREEQLQEETEEDRFRRWIRLEESGDQICEIDQHWKQQYETTSEFRGRKLIYDEYGPTAFQMGQ